MKFTVKTWVVLFALLGTPLLCAAQDQKELVTIISTKRYVFHFKVDKSLIGGTVSIIDGDYKIIKTENITTRKKIIDFFEFSAGYYTVRIIKGDKEINILYQNFE